MIRNSEESSTGTATPPRTGTAQLPEDIADGYYESDLEGCLTAANRSLCRLLGCADPAQIVGQLPTRFFDPDGWERVRQIGKRVRASGEPAPLIECSIIRTDGERRTFELSMALIRRGGEPTGFCGIVRDVTARAAAAAESTRLVASLETQLEESLSRYTRVSEQELLKTHMIRVAAHDLRGPLSIIASYVELLHEDLAAHYNDMDDMYVNAIRQAIERMTQLTTDILSVARLYESHDLALTRVELGGLLEMTAAEFDDEMHQRQQTAAVSIEPLTVCGNARELHEAIANLLNNAIKYSPVGGTISVALRREGEFAVLEIVDNGYGIPADQQTELFQPFHRIKTRETYAIDGTGLGLYLVKRIVERHDGSVHYHSEHGKGSLFGFRLALAQPEDT